MGADTPFVVLEKGGPCVSGEDVLVDVCDGDRRVACSTVTRGAGQLGDGFEGLVSVLGNGGSGTVDGRFHVRVVGASGPLSKGAADKEALVRHAELLKEEGNELIKEDAADAAACYTKALRVLEACDAEFGRGALRDAGPRKACHLNLALCCLNLGGHTEALTHLGEVLDVDPRNEKALFRKGLCHLGLGDHAAALSAFQAVLEVAPGNAGARRHKKECLDALKAENHTDRELYKTMF